MWHEYGGIGKVGTVASVLAGLTVLLVLGCAKDRTIVDRPAGHRVQSSPVISGVTQESGQPPAQDAEAEVIQNTDVAGVWWVKCEAEATDCHGFAIRFAEGGDIMDYEAGVHDGPAKGMASVSNGKLHFVVAGIVEFDGPLDEYGLTATGELKGQSADGTPTTATVTAVRRNPLCDEETASRRRSCQ